MMWRVQAWLPGALEFSKVPTAHTQAPAVPVCGWWAKGKDDGALVANVFCLVCAMPAWMGTGGKEVVHPCPCELENQMLPRKASKQVLSLERPASVCLTS